MNSSKISQTNDISGYLLIYFVIGFSVIPFFTEKPDLLAIITIVLAIYIISKSRLTLERHFLWVLAFLFLMYMGQLLTLRLTSIDYRSIFGTFIRFLFPYLVLLFLGKRFFYMFTKVVYGLTLIVLIFWTADNLIPNFTYGIKSISEKFQLDQESNENILIYNAENHLIYGVIKNAGFAYEGGAYSIILIIAIIFNLVINKYLFDRKTKVLIFALITTFSTAGYIALALIFYGLFFTKIINKFRLIIFSAFFLSILVYSYTTLSFLEEKIDTQIELTQDPFATRGRFASAMADLLEWQRNPFFGVGKFEETRFAIFKDINQQHRVNGLASLLAKYGLVVFVGYLFVLYNSLRKFNYHFLQTDKFVIFQFMALMSLAFAQECMTWSVLIILLYLPLIENKNYIPLYNYDSK